MTRLAKLVARFKSRPRDFTWDELVQLLSGLGYLEAKAGKTGGSRRRFVHETAPTIALHKPHPGKILKLYALDQVRSTLEKESLI